MHTVELYRKVRLACRDGMERAGGGGVISGFRARA